VCGLCALGGDIASVRSAKWPTIAWLTALWHALRVLCAMLTVTCAAAYRSVVQTLRAIGAAQLYAGSMSPPAVEQVIAALQLIQDADGSGRGPRKLSQLRENSNYFREKLQEIGLNVLGDRDSPVMVRSQGPWTLPSLSHSQSSRQGTDANVAYYLHLVVKHSMPRDWQLHHRS